MRSVCPQLVMQTVYCQTRVGLHLIGGRYTNTAGHACGASPCVNLKTNKNSAHCRNTPVTRHWPGWDYAHYVHKTYSFPRCRQ